MAELMGIIPGMSLDLTENDIDGQPWDFNNPEKRERAEELVRNKKALLLTNALGDYKDGNHIDVFPREGETDAEAKARVKHCLLTVCCRKGPVSFPTRNWTKPEQAIRWALTLLVVHNLLPEAYEVFCRMLGTARRANQPGAQAEARSLRPQ